MARKAPARWSPPPVAGGLSPSARTRPAIGSRQDASPTIDSAARNSTGSGAGRGLERLAQIVERQPAAAARQRHVRRPRAPSSIPSRRAAGSAASRSRVRSTTRSSSGRGDRFARVAERPAERDRTPGSLRQSLLGRARHRRTGSAGARPGRRLGHGFRADRCARDRLRARRAAGCDGRRRPGRAAPAAPRGGPPPGGRDRARQPSERSTAGSAPSARAGTRERRLTAAAASGRLRRRRCPGSARAGVERPRIADRFERAQRRRCAPPAARSSRRARAAGRRRATRSP